MSFVALFLTSLRCTNRYYIYLIQTVIIMLFFFFAGKLYSMMLRHAQNLFSTDAVWVKYALLYSIQGCDCVVFVQKEVRPNTRL